MINPDAVDRALRTIRETERGKNPAEGYMYDVNRWRGGCPCAVDEKIGIKVDEEKPR